MIDRSVRLRTSICATAGVAYATSRLFYRSQSLVEKIWRTESNKYGQSYAGKKIVPSRCIIIAHSVAMSEFITYLNQGIELFGVPPSCSKKHQCIKFGFTPLALKSDLSLPSLDPASSHICKKIFGWPTLPTPEKLNKSRKEVARSSCRVLVALLQRQNGWRNKAADPDHLSKIRKFKFTLSR